jgi:hypothetical protein
MYLAIESFKTAFRDTPNNWERRLNISWGIMRTGVAIMVALITEAIWKAPTIPWSWRVSLYILGGLAVFAGSLGIILEMRWHNGRRHHKDGLP